MAIEVWSDPTPRVALHPLSLPTLGRDADALVAPLTGLSRVRGGTYSPTVGVVRFDDGTTAHTDLIRLNPSIDAYSLDFPASPPPLAHYRETRWTDLPSTPAALVLAILNHSYPHISPRRLTERVRAAGYPISRGQLPVHAIISATQAAIWHVTNGLDLDVRPLDLPVRVASRSADGRTRRQMPSAALDWRAALPPARVHLGSRFCAPQSPRTRSRSVRTPATTPCPYSSSSPPTASTGASCPGRRSACPATTTYGRSAARSASAPRSRGPAATSPSRATGTTAWRSPDPPTGTASWTCATYGCTCRRVRAYNDGDVVHVYDYLSRTPSAVPRGAAPPRRP